ncbi:MAG: PLP-dependent aminotransferase family protein [Mycobacterium sp.]
MISHMTGRRLDVDLLARELGHWRTSSSAGPAYLALADAVRLLVVDGRIPVGACLPSERALADALRVSRTTVTAAYAQLRDDGYLNARRGALSTTALPVGELPNVAPGQASVDLARAAMGAPAAAMRDAYTHAAEQITAHLHGTGIELTGLTSLRIEIAERYCARGLPTDFSEIMITTGALHAISLILGTYIQRGDRVLVEQPTYPGALAAIGAAGARPVPVSIAADGTEAGWDLSAMHAAIRQLSPNLAYLIPDNHNPTGLTLPADERHRLAQLISETRTRTIIDETMTEVWIDQPVPQPVAAAMTSRRELVLTTGSMSKAFWGGLRIGWIRGERSALASIAAQRPALDMGTPILEQLAAAWLLAHADEVLPDRRETLRARRELLRSLLAEHLPDWRASPNTGGVALWVQLPTPMSSALSAMASRIGLELPPGPRFGVDGTLERYVRVPYTLPEEQLTEAVELLSRAWHWVTGTGSSGYGAVVV